MGYRTRRWPAACAIVCAQFCTATSHRENCGNRPIFFGRRSMASTPASWPGAHPLRRSGSAAIGLMLAVLVNGKGAVYLLVCRTKQGYKGSDVL